MRHQFSPATVAKAIYSIALEHAPPEQANKLGYSLSYIIARYVTVGEVDGKLNDFKYIKQELGHIAQAVSICLAGNSMPRHEIDSILNSTFDPAELKFNPLPVKHLVGFDRLAVEEVNERWPVISLSRETIFLQDDNGQTALHIEFSKKGRIAWEQLRHLELEAEEWVRALSIQDEKGNTPLHCLTENENRWERDIRSDTLRFIDLDLCAIRMVTNDQSEELLLIPNKAGDIPLYLSHKTHDNYMRGRGPGQFRQALAFSA